jgi:hypothetical protein
LQRGYFGVSLQGDMVAGRTVYPLPMAAIISKIK